MRQNFLFLVWAMMARWGAAFRTVVIIGLVAVVVNVIWHFVPDTDEVTPETAAASDTVFVFDGVPILAKGEWRQLEDGWHISGTRSNQYVVIAFGGSNQLMVTTECAEARISNWSEGTAMTVHMDDHGHCRWLIDAMTWVGIEHEDATDLYEQVTHDLGSGSIMSLPTPHYVGTSFSYAVDRVICGTNMDDSIVHVMGDAPSWSTESLLHRGIDVGVPPFQSGWYRIPCGEADLATCNAGANFITIEKVEGGSDTTYGLACRFFTASETLLSSPGGGDATN